MPGQVDPIRWEFEGRTYEARDSYILADDPPYMVYDVTDGEVGRTGCRQVGLATQAHIHRKVNAAWLAKREFDQAEADLRALREALAHVPASTHDWTNR